MTSNENATIQTKSEILFLYESTYNIPNGDPFTGEQRYDEETKKILVSDVRIKRFIRDYLEANNYVIYVTDKTEIGVASSKQMIKHLYEKTFEKKIKDVKKILLECIDVRLFGGISTLDKKEAKVGGVQLENPHLNLTGPVQFALLNPSLNECQLRMHQNTSHFRSKDDNQQGAIGTTTVVPYAVNQIHGWINPYSAKYTNLTDDDINIMFKALWESINNANTRTKSNQNSILLLQIIYSDQNKKLYGIDHLIKLKTKDKKEEQLRSSDDYEIDFTGLIEKVNCDAVERILYYTEIQAIDDLLNDKPKFVKMFLPEFNTNGEDKQ